MKSFVLVFLLCSPVVYADVTANCTTYSKEYDLKMRIGTDTATIQVTRAEPRSAEFFLRTGDSFSLSRQESQSADWLHFEGRVGGEQTAELNVSRQELEKSNFELNLIVSGVYDDSSGVDHEVECSQVP